MERRVEYIKRVWRACAYIIRCSETPTPLYLLDSVIIECSSNLKAFIDNFLTFPSVY